MLLCPGIHKYAKQTALMVSFSSTEGLSMKLVWSLLLAIACAFSWKFTATHYPHPVIGSDCLFKVPFRVSTDSLDHLFFYLLLDLLHFSCFFLFIFIWKSKTALFVHNLYIRYTQKNIPKGSSAVPSRLALLPPSLYLSLLSAKQYKIYC